MLVGWSEALLEVPVVNHPESGGEYSDDEDRSAGSPSPSMRPAGAPHQAPPLELPDATRTSSSGTDSTPMPPIARFGNMKTPPPVPPRSKNAIQGRARLPESRTRGEVMGDCTTKLQLLACLEFLVLNGADLEVTDPSRGWTPLFFAVNNGSADVVKLLISHRCNLQHVGGKMTIFQLAREVDAQDCLSLIQMAMAREMEREGQAQQ